MDTQCEYVGEAGSIRDVISKKYAEELTCSYYNIHITNMRNIHTYIVSRHLATRGNNTILRTPPSHISSSEEILPRLTVAPLPNSEQIRMVYLKGVFSHPCYSMSIPPTPACTQ